MSHYIKLRKAANHCIWVAGIRLYLVFLLLKCPKRWIYYQNSHQLTFSLSFSFQLYTLQIKFCHLAVNFTFEPKAELVARVWLYGVSFVFPGFCCCTQLENKHLLDNRHSLVELALFRSAHSKVLTRVSSLFSLPAVMLWVIMLWPPVNPACSPVTTAISGCSIVMPCLLLTDWMRQVRKAPLDQTQIQYQLELFAASLCRMWLISLMSAGLNLLLWGDLPELDDSENEESESPSEEECIR